MVLMTYSTAYDLFKIRRGKDSAKTFTGLGSALLRYVAFGSSSPFFDITVLAPIVLMVRTSAHGRCTIRSGLRF
jgi:hypothetical protein